MCRKEKKFIFSNFVLYLNDVEFRCHRKVLIYAGCHILIFWKTSVARWLIFFTNLFRQTTDAWDDCSDVMFFDHSNLNLNPIALRDRILVSHFRQKFVYDADGFFFLLDFIGWKLRLLDIIIKDTRIWGLGIVQQNK